MTKKASRKSPQVVPGLMPDPKNARRHTDRNKAAIRSSMEQFGAARSIVVDADNIVRAGNGALEAAESLGIPTRVIETDGTELIAIKRTDLTGAKAQAYGIADNRTAELAEWDEEHLKHVLEQTSGITTAELLGFTDQELAEVLAMPVPDPSITEDEVPPTPVDPITQTGDLWILGEHRLLCGDSRVAETFGRLLDGSKADICFTSPPYGAGKAAKLRDKYKRGASKRESFYDAHGDDPEDWAGLMVEWFTASRQHATATICNVQMLADNKRQMIEWLYAFRDDLSDVVIWDKGNAAPQMQANVLSNSFEFLFILGGNASRSIPFAEFHGTLSNVIRIDPRGKNEHADVHRAVMPIDLAAWVLSQLCPLATSVLEPFCGTGTTLIAAEQLGRRCFGIEISQGYCDVIVKRWEKLTGRTAERISASAEAPAKPKKKSRRSRSAA